MKHLRYILAFAFFLAGANSFAQHSHDGKVSSVFDKYETPQVVYQIKANVDARHGTINGWIDLAYTNLSSDTLRSICLDFSNSPYDDTMQFNFHDTAYQSLIRSKLTEGKYRYLWLDSVLYQAAPLTGFARMNGTKMVELPLPVPLYPGEVGPLIVAFRMQFRPPADSLKRNLYWELIEDWFPQVAHYYDSGWHPVGDMETTNDHPMATYEISLAVDSAFHLIAPGELINRKEHYGTTTFPEGDTVAIDITSFLYAFVPDYPYRPKFEGGVKRYAYRLLDGNDFGLLLTNEPHIDLADAEGLPIQVVYSEKDAPVYRERVAAVAREVTLSLTEKYGAYPFPSVLIVTLPAGAKTPDSRTMLGLCPQLAGNSDIYGALAKLISRSWLADFLPTEEAVKVMPYFSSVDEALAAITAEDLVATRAGDNTIGPAEMAADNIEGWTLATPYHIERAKTALNELSLQSGRDKFSRMLMELSRRYHFRLVRYYDFTGIVRDICETAIDEQPNVNQR